MAKRDHVTQRYPQILLANISYAACPRGEFHALGFDCVIDGCYHVECDILLDIDIRCTEDPRGKSMAVVRSGCIAGRCSRSQIWALPTRIHLHTGEYHPRRQTLDVSMNQGMHL